jgi:hypothetical protein
MTKTSYAKTIDQALVPLEFRREGDNLIRVRGDIWRCVDRYSSRLGGVKVTLLMLDLETEKLHRRILGRGMVTISCALGELIDGRDRRWGDAPELMATPRLWSTPYSPLACHGLIEAGLWRGRPMSGTGGDLG